MVLHPVGPLPASTYWRRRAVLLAVVVVLVLLLRSCVGGEAVTPTAGSAGPTATGTPTPRSTSSSGPTPRPTLSPTRPAGPVTCADSGLRLTTRTDARSYPAGTTPKITVTVTNRSGQTCRRDLGGKALEVLVYSGSDRIWSSDDCEPDTASAVQTLAAGATLETSVRWPRVRSAKGCPSSRPEARPGTYVVRARLGTLEAERTVFGLAG